MILYIYLAKNMILFWIYLLAEKKYDITLNIFTSKKV